MRHSSCCNRYAISDRRLRPGDRKRKTRSSVTGLLSTTMQFLLTIARSSLARPVIGWIFEHMSFAIPVKRLRETETLLAFHHPKPDYPVHILLMPKKAIRSLADLKEEDYSFLAEVFETAQSLVKDLNLAESSYRLIVNGGDYQDVPQLHFHLVSGDQGTGN
jgi:histidine triad (HIT) family protein